MAELNAYYVGAKGQRLRVEGVAPEDSVATVPDDLKFMMYFVVMRKMKIRPPFTAFQREVLRHLRVAPSQLHPNAWVFVRAFEMITGAFGRPWSSKLFFSIFEVSHRGEDGAGRERWENLSLKIPREYKFFRPYADSMKPWKYGYTWVVPVCDEAKCSKADLDGTDRVCNTPF